MTATPHRWNFFRSGGFDQVRLDSAADLAALRHLDQKLWAALACPVQGMEFDARTLEYIDTDRDGRIRAPELLAAVDWALSVLADPQVLFKGESLPLAAIADNEAGRHLAASARRLLVNIGKADAQAVSIDDSDDFSRVFPPDKPNGDGLVPAAMTEDGELQQAIADIIAVLGADTDRSKEPAVSEEKINEFFAQADTLRAWRQRGADDGALMPLGEATAAAVNAFCGVREKIDDFFNRVRLAAFDPRAGTLMNGEESVLVQLAAQNLADSSGAAALPLAHVAAGRDLPLQEGVNPAWAAALADFSAKVVTPLLGARTSISASEWSGISARFAPHLSWLAEKPALAVGALDTDRVQWLLQNDIREKLLALVEQDRAVSAEAEGLIDVDRLVRFQRHLVTLLNNFVSLRDFYTRRAKAVFQAGTLFIDGRSADLTVRVHDAARHGAMAGSSGSYLVYCDCTRQGSSEKMTIVAALTAGDAGNLIVGRNGIFYDRKGVDWDATVIKLVEHPISVREAFWRPYRRLGKMASEQMQKMAAARDKAIEDKTAAGVGDAAKKIESAPAAAAPAPAPFDVARFAGIFAAIGLAIGAIGTVLTAVLAGFLSLKWWQMPMAVAGLLLLVSGPSMVIAWFKLRKRSLAPILDANGWAVNTQANINIAFGTALTQLALLPEGAQRSLSDPYAEKRRAWPWFLLAAVVVAGAGWWGYTHGWFTR
jgi:hypothetical protein